MVAYCVSLRRPLLHACVSHRTVCPNMSVYMSEGMWQPIGANTCHCAGPESLRSIFLFRAQHMPWNHMWQDAALQGSVNMFMDISAHLRQSGCQTILFISQAIKMGATISVAWSAFTLLEKIRAVCQPLIPIIWLDSDMSSCVVPHRLRGAQGERASI